MTSPILSSATWMSDRAVPILVADAGGERGLDLKHTSASADCGTAPLA